MHVTVVKRDDGWMMFEGNADTTLLDGPMGTKKQAESVAESYVDEGYYDEAKIYTASGRLARTYEGRDSPRESGDITTVSQLEPGDKMTPKPGSNVGGRRLYGSKWKVDSVNGSTAVLRRLQPSGPTDETLVVDDGDMDQFSIYTTNQSRRFWRGYTQEGGHHIM